jgi:NAD(P)-dependent dehydrogenase (short-subunit alcohol dehydrogenase family)
MTDAAGPLVVLITGCSSGIGREVARLCAARGFRVYATMRRTEAGEGLRAEAAAAGWNLSTPVLDVGDTSSVERAVGAVLAETSGRLDVVINNAGYFCIGAIEDTSAEELAAQLDTNLVGVLRVCRAVLPAMRAAGRGRLVNVTSLSALVNLPVMGPYQISKAALEALNETLRYEVAPFGVQVVAVAPGPFKTELHAKEVATVAARRSDSAYAALLGRYRRLDGHVRRAPVDRVARAIVRAAVMRRPPRRMAVGPLSFLATTGRSVTPDRVFQWLVGLIYGWRR